MKLINNLFISPFLWLKNSIKDIKNWISLYNVVSNEENKSYLLKETGLKVDWIGRLYTVIKTPEEIAYHPFEREPYVIAQMKKYNPALMKLRIIDMVYPEIIYKKDDNGAPMYESPLLILTPITENLNLYSIFINLLKLTFIGFLVNVLIKFLLFTSLGQLLIEKIKLFINFAING
jgi:hypothetical protein